MGWTPSVVGAPLKPLDPSKIPPPQPPNQHNPPPTDSWFTQAQACRERGGTWDWNAGVCLPPGAPAADDGSVTTALIATGALSLVFGVLIGKFLIR